MIVPTLLAAVFALATGDVVTTERNAPGSFDPFEHFHAVNVYGSDLQYRQSAKLYPLGSATPVAVTTLGDNVIVAELQQPDRTAIVSYDVNGTAKTITTLDAAVTALRPWGPYLFAAFGNRIGQIDPITGWLITTRTVSEAVTDIDVDQTGCSVYAATTNSVYLVGLCTRGTQRLFHDENEFPTAVRILPDGDLLVGAPSHVLRMSNAGQVRATISTSLDIDRGYCKVAVTPDPSGAVAACGWHLWQLDLVRNTGTLRGTLHDAVAPTGVVVRGEWRLFKIPSRHEAASHR